MTEDVTESIRALLAKHYSASNDVLLLSDLGKMLKNAGSWPLLPDDPRTLIKIVEGLAPEIVLIRDPEAPAYVAVVPADKQELASEAIEARRGTNLLRKLPRPVLLAFCIKETSGRPVYVRVTPPFRYNLGEPAESGFELVEEQFRSPGLYVEDLSALSAETVLALVKKIDAWAKQHDVHLRHIHADDKPKSPHDAPAAPPPKKEANALERLYGAQPPGLAVQMVIPFDIAVYLSRLP